MKSKDIISTFFFDFDFDFLLVASKPHQRLKLADITFLRKL